MRPHQLIGPLPRYPRNTAPVGSVILINESSDRLSHAGDGYTLAAHDRARALAMWQPGVTLVGWDWEPRTAHNPKQYNEGFLAGALADPGKAPRHTHRIGFDL